MNRAWQHSTHHAGSACTITLGGELDMSAEQELSRLLTAELNRSGTETVQADFDAVTFVDSTAIGVLVGAYRDARATGRRFTITHAHGHVRRVLDLTGILTALSSDRTSPTS